jgi:hypothetical protein
LSEKGTLRSLSKNALSKLIPCLWTFCAKTKLIKFRKGAEKCAEVGGGTCFEKYIRTRGRHNWCWILGFEWNIKDLDD